MRSRYTRAGAYAFLFPLSPDVWELQLTGINQELLLDQIMEQADLERITLVSVEPLPYFLSSGRLFVRNPK